MKETQGEGKRESQRRAATGRWEVKTTHRHREIRKGETDEKAYPFLGRHAGEKENYEVLSSVTDPKTLATLQGGNKTKRSPQKRKSEETKFTKVMCKQR